MIIFLNFFCLPFYIQTKSEITSKFKLRSFNKQSFYRLKIERPVLFKLYCLLTYWFLKYSRRGRPRKTTSRLKFQTEIGEEEYVLSDTDNEAEAQKKKPAAKRKTREEEPEPEYDLFENIPRTSASLHQADLLANNQASDDEDEDQMPLHPTTTPAAKKAKSSIFISKSTAKSKTPKKSSKSAANNTQKSKKTTRSSARLSASK